MSAVAQGSLTGSEKGTTVAARFGRMSVGLLLLLMLPLRIGAAIAGEGPSSNIVGNDVANTVSNSIEKTVALCRSFDSAAALELAYQGARDLVLEQNILSLGSELEVIVNSDGFIVGLRSCFGDDEWSKHLFLVALLSADISGKAAGAATLLGGPVVWEGMMQGLARMEALRGVLGKSATVAARAALQGAVFLAAVDAVCEVWQEAGPKAPSELRVKAQNGDAEKEMQKGQRQPEDAHLESAPESSEEQTEKKLMALQSKAAALAASRLVELDRQIQALPAGSAQRGELENLAAKIRELSR